MCYILFFKNNLSNYLFFTIKIVSKFMQELHYNYSFKFVSCVHLSFLIFVSSELMSAKY